MLIIFKQIYSTKSWSPNSYYHSGSVDLGVMAMNGYSTVPEAPELEPYHWKQFSVIPRHTFILMILGKAWIHMFSS